MNRNEFWRKWIYRNFCVSRSIGRDIELREWIIRTYMQNALSKLMNIGILKDKDTLMEIHLNIHARIAVSWTHQFWFARAFCACLASQEMAVLSATLWWVSTFLCLVFAYIILVCFAHCWLKSNASGLCGLALQHIRKWKMRLRFNVWSSGLGGLNLKTKELRFIAIKKRGFKLSRYARGLRG